MFDFVIIGAGSAGCALAARLSEDRNSTVLLIEAGPLFPVLGYPMVLKDATHVVRRSRYDWSLRSEPEAGGHVIDVTAGRVAGGGSALNAATFRRATPSDFAQWRGADQAGWSWPEILDAYVAIESYQIAAELKDGTQHGHDGPVTVCQLSEVNATRTISAFVHACTALGYENLSDYNSVRQEGIAFHARNVVQGVRLNTAMTYLSDEVRARSNLSIRSNREVDTVWIEDGNAKGVRLVGGEKISAKETILSAGAYGSPAILLRSGVGPAQDLAALGVPLAMDKPVGRGLKDQPVFISSFPLREEVRDLSPSNGATLAVRSITTETEIPDLHVFMEHQFDAAAGGRPTLHIGAAVMRPFSAGSVMLRSRNPLDPPVILLNLLADERDQARLLEAVKLANKVARTPPLSGLIDWDAAEARDVPDDETLMAMIRERVSIFYHACRTVRMGDPLDVEAAVDWAGHVHGIKNLRVVDASILPEMIAVATNPTVIMVAERIAKMIRTGG